MKNKFSLLNSSLFYFYVILVSWTLAWPEVVTQNEPTPKSQPTQEKSASSPSPTPEPSPSTASPIPVQPVPPNAQIPQSLPTPSQPSDSLLVKPPTIIMGSRWTGKNGGLYGDYSLSFKPKLASSNRLNSEPVKNIALGIELSEHI